MLASAAKIFRNFCNAPRPFPFFLFFLIIGILETVCCMNTVNSGVFSVDGVTSMVNAGACSCLSWVSFWIVLKGVFRRVCHWWIWGIVLIVLHPMDVCESVGV